MILKDFFQKVNSGKSQQMTKIMKNYLACKELRKKLHVDIYHLRASADGLLEPDGFLVFDEVLGLGGGIFSPS